MSRCPWTSRTARPPRSSRATSTRTRLCRPSAPSSLQDAAEYVRMNVLPRPGPQPQPPPQIIGRTAAVAAEKGEVAVAAEGVGGAFGYLGGLQKEQQPSHPRREWSDGCHGWSWRCGNGRVGCATRRRRSLRPGPRRQARQVPHASLPGPKHAIALSPEDPHPLFEATRMSHGLGAGEHALPAQQGSEDAAVQDVRSANNMNDATQPQHFTLRSGSSTSGSKPQLNGRGSEALKLAGSVSGECLFGNSFSSLYPRRIIAKRRIFPPPTPGNKKSARRIFPPPTR